MMRRRTSACLTMGLLAAAAMLMAACGGDDGNELRVFAAASLTDAFEEAAEAFEENNEGIEVAFNFAGSPTLVTQLQEGADADLLATADVQSMESASESGVVGDARNIFARNRLMIVVPADNPAGIEAPADLAGDGVKLVLALPDVPAGRYARESLAKMAADPAFGEEFDDTVLANVVSEEPNVKAVLTKVQLGEADAGIVYASDVTEGIADDVEAIEIDDAFNVTAEYAIAITEEAGEPGLAQQFIDFLLSDPGQAALEAYGLTGIP